MIEEEVVISDLTFAQATMKCKKLF